MTLTELSYYSRRMLPLFIIFSIVFFIFVYAIKLMFIYLDLAKPHIVYTNPVFGPISQPMIKDASASAGYAFTLDTIEGQPITSSEAAKVYFLPQSSARFGYTQKIYPIAKLFGFDIELIKHNLADKIATFVDGKRKLAIDITNYNFRYEYAFNKNPKLFEQSAIPSRNEIENKTIDFLKTVGRYPEELAKGKTNIVYLQYNTDQENMTPVQRSVDANAVEIDFYRPDIDTFSTVSPSYFNSQNFMVLAFQENEMVILRAQIAFFEKSEEQIGVYPLKTGDVAWEELKTGKGIVVSPGKTNREVSIKKMFTAYFDSDTYQQYLQPVYVFLGSDNFVGYVPAVVNKYLTE